MRFLERHSQEKWLRERFGSSRAACFVLGYCFVGAVAVETRGRCRWRLSAFRHVVVADKRYVPQVVFFRCCCLFLVFKRDIQAIKRVPGTSDRFPRLAVQRPPPQLRRRRRHCYIVDVMKAENVADMVARGG